MSSSRVSGIEIVYEFEGIAMGYRVKGHVDKEEFVAAVRREWKTRIRVIDVRHRHVRNVPLGRDFPGKTFMMKCQPGRGAYAITCTDTLGVR